KGRERRGISKHRTRFAPNSPPSASSSKSRKTAHAGNASKPSVIPSDASPTCHPERGVLCRVEGPCVLCTPAPPPPCHPERGVLCRVEGPCVPLRLSPHPQPSLVTSVTDSALFNPALFRNHRVPRLRSG